MSFYLGKLTGIYNSFNRRIKYAQFNLIAFNPVNDRVGELEKIKGVGFVELGETANWEFDNVFYNKTITSVSIESVLLTFEDGSKKSINKNNLVFSEILSHESSINYVQFGSLLLNEYQIEDESYFSLEYFSLFDSEYEFVPLVSSGIEQFTLDLMAAIDNAKKGIPSESGLFKTTPLTDRIYYSGNELKGNILYIVEAEKLLSHLKSEL